MKTKAKIPPPLPILYIVGRTAHGEGYRDCKTVKEAAAYLMRRGLEGPFFPVKALHGRSFALESNTQEIAAYKGTSVADPREEWTHDDIVELNKHLLFTQAVVVTFNIDGHTHSTITSVIEFSSFSVITDARIDAYLKSRYQVNPFTWKRVEAIDRVALPNVTT